MAGLFSLALCVPAEDKFVEEVLRDFNTTGFLHPQLMQVTCSAETLQYNLDFASRVEKNRERARELCRERLAEELGRAHITREIATETGRKNIEIKIKFTLEQIRILNEDFADLLKKMYVAREIQRPSGGVELVARLYHPDLVDRLSDREIRLDFEKAR